VPWPLRSFLCSLPLSHLPLSSPSPPLRLSLLSTSIHLLDLTLSSYGSLLTQIPIL
jgi:hypothetical protein